MRKAYDSVEWEFLKQVLIQFQFPGVFVEWIFQCIRTVSYTILINGYPSTPFEATIGLRQGDLLSPYLFVLAMEYFTRLLKQRRKSPNFKYHPRCAKMQLIQLSFADDLLLFSKGDITFVRRYMRASRYFHHHLDWRQM